MQRWLACAVLAAFILGDPAGAEEATGRDRYWVDAAALKWKIGDAPQPTALVTAGSLTAPLPGALGQPGTSVQIGGTSVSLPTELGGRFALGTWIDRAAALGIELGAFVLSPGTARQSVSTNGMPGSATYAVPLFDLSGFTSRGAPGQSMSGGAGAILGGGIFAQPSNIGTYGSHQLAGVAELGVRTGYRVTETLIPYIAYNALYVGSIIRPGDAMSPYINTTATALAAASRGSGFASPVGGPLGPTVNAGGTGVWIQDVSAGLALRF